MSKLPIEFEHITQAHLNALNEYLKTKHSVKNCAIAAGMKLPVFKRVLTEALGLAGGISYWEERAKARKKIERFFEQWYSVPRRPAPEKEEIERYEAPPRIRPCNAPRLHDPAITEQQMDCLRQFVSQPNIARAAEAMGLNKVKFKNELRHGLEHAASLSRKPFSASPLALSKGEQVQLVHRYFDLLESRENTMNDPMF